MTVSDAVQALDGKGRSKEEIQGDLGFCKAVTDLLA